MMTSIVAESRAELEARGQYVVRANADSGWFAVFPKTWRQRVAAARQHGREGPDLIVYRTRSADPRDHHVIPFTVIRELFVDKALSQSKGASDRWNGTLKENQLRVTHLPRKVDVGAYFRTPLLTEEVKYYTPDEVEAEPIFHEGAVRRIQVNAYERDRQARARCIEHYGRRCVVCRMSFEEVYGPDAASIIHVHHLVALSSVGQEYEVDPVRDLRPVCPNCHAVIHSRTPAYSVEEVMTLLRNHAPVSHSPQA